MSRLPPWEDEDAVFEWIMAGKDWLNPGADEISPLSERIEDAMRDAVEAARQGNDHPLADLLRDDHPFNKLEPPIRSQLTPEAFRLIADRLDGKPRNPHAPKMTAQERQAKNPVHEAARIEPLIELKLWGYYGDGQYYYYDKKTTRKIRERACDFAARIMNKERGTDLKWKTVRKHLRRPEEDHRRIKSAP
jgi:hypothetical protein